MKSNGLCIFALSALQIVWLDATYCQSVSDAKIKEEMSKQESIYHGKGEQRPDGYTVDRSLWDYAQILSGDFDGTLANLGPNDRWLDIGAGTGQAILDYYDPGNDQPRLESRSRRGKKAKAVAMSIEDRRTSYWQQTAASLDAGQMQYLSSKRLREYSPEELGKFQVITDVVGGFSYSVDLSLFMEKALAILDVKGHFYTLLQDVQSEEGTNKPYYQNSPFLTEIKTSAGEDVKMCSWLKSISCVQVTCEFKTPWKPPIEVYRIRKVCNEVKVPALTPIHYEAGTPPERRYQVKN